MRIVYTLQEDLTDPKGGMGHFRAVAEQLALAGHEICVLAGRYHRNVLPFSAPRIRFWWIPLLRFRGVFLLYQVLSAIGFPLLVLWFRPKALLIRAGGGLFFLLCWVARVFRVRVVLEINGLVWEEMASRGQSRFLQALIRWSFLKTCRAAHSMICVTPGLAEEIVSHSGIARERFYVIQNGAPPVERRSEPDRTRIREQWGLSENTLAVGFVGSFDPWHGVSDILQAARHVPPALQPHIVLVLVGHAQDDSDLAAEVKALPVRVITSGWQDRAMLSKIMSALDAGIFVTSDRSKRNTGTTPLKFWEYLAAGLPVLASHDANLSSLIRRYEFGILIDPVTPQAIARGLEELWTRREECPSIGRRNAELLAKHFSWKCVAERVAAVLQNDTRWIRDVEYCRSIQSGRLDML